MTEPRARGRARRRASLAVFGLLVFLSSVSLYFSDQRLLSDRTRLLTLLVFALLAWFFAPPERLLTALTRLARWMVVRERVVVPALAVFASASAAAACLCILEPMPHVADELAYLFQAKVFASGNLAVPTPSMPEFFTAHWVIPWRGQRFSLFPPGWSGLLAAGVLAGAPWLVNPIISGLCILAVHRLARQLLGPPKALAVVALCVVSPFFVFMGASFLSHPASLLFTTLSVLFALEGTRQGRLLKFVVAGLCAGVAFLIRPLDAVVIWAVTAATLLWTQRTRAQLFRTLLFAVPLALAGVAFIAYNHALSGDFRTSLVTLDSSRNRIGFGSGVGLSWAGFPSLGHTPYRGLLNLNHNMAVLGIDLFGWPVSSLWPAFVAVIWGFRSEAIRLATAICAGLAFAYLFYWYHGVCFGARFYFSALPFVLMLTVEGLARAQAVVFANVAPWRGRHFHVATFAALCFGFSALVYVPTLGFVEAHPDQRGVTSDLEHFVREQQIDRGLVFVGPGLYLYLPAFGRNELDPLTSPVVYALERGPDDQRLASALPQLPVHHFTHHPPASALSPLARRVLHEGYVRRGIERVPIPGRLRALFRP